jgi:hypothetical protein
MRYLSKIVNGKAAKGKLLCMLMRSLQRYQVILADPDRHPGSAGPDPYPFQPNVKLNYTF